MNYFNADERLSQWLNAQGGRSELYPRIDLALVRDALTLIAELLRENAEARRGRPVAPRGGY